MSVRKTQAPKPAAAQSTTSRRLPTQQRARARVERILKAAEALITRQGIANLKLNEVAIEAGVPIGSVYEYFRGREDVIQALAERHHRIIEADVARTFSDVTSIEMLLAAIEQSINGAWRYVMQNPAYRELLCGVQAWEGLRDLDWSDTLANANILADAAAPLLPKIDRDEVLAACLIICDAAGSTARLAMHFNAYEQALNKSFVEMARNQFLDLMRRNISA